MQNDEIETGILYREMIEVDQKLCCDERSEWGLGLEQGESRRARTDSGFAGLCETGLRHRMQIAEPFRWNNDSIMTVSLCEAMAVTVAKR